MTNQTQYMQRHRTTQETGNRPKARPGRRFPSVPPTVAAYTVAIVAPLLALALWWVFHPINGNLASPMLFNVAVVLAAWRGGFLPGLIATALSLALTAWFIFPPTGSFAIAAADHQTRLIAGGIAGIIVSLVGGAALSATKRLRGQAESLRESEERYRLLYENQPVGVAIGHPLGRILSMNAAGLHLHGFSSETEMLSALDQYARVFEIRYLDGRIMPLDDWPASRAIRGDFVKDYEIRLCNLITRQERIVSYSVSPVYDADGHIARFVYVIHDLTERRNAERALRVSENRYRTLFDAIDEGFCIIEVIFDEEERAIDYRFIETNPAFEKQTGLTDVQGKRVRELIPNHDEHWFTTYGAIALTGEPARFEDRAESLNRWFDVYAFRFGDPDLRQVAVLFNDITERKQAEVGVRESEERLRLALKAATMDAFVYDPASDRVRRSGSLWPILGLEEEGTATVYFDRIHPEDRETFLSTVQSLTPLNPAYTFEYRFRSYDGQWRWLADHAEMHFHADGSQAYLNGVCTDITERKLADEAVRESQERYLLVNRATNDIIWDWDLTTNALNWNEVIETATGRSRAEMPPTIESWYQHIHPDDRDRVVAGIHEAIDGPALSWSDEYRFGPIDGPYRIYLDRGLIARDPNGKAYRMIGSMLDLTETRRTEEALRESEQRFRATFENAAVGIAHQGLDGRWLRVNDRYCEITGYSRDELQERTSSDITHPDDIDADFTHLRRVLNGEFSRYSMEKRYIRKDGSSVWVNLTRSLVRTDQGRPDYFIAIVEDISWRKAYQFELEFQKFALDQAAIVAITDAQGTITYVNDKFTQISGYSREELIGGNHRIINSGYHPKEFFRDLYATIRNGQIWRGEIRNRRKDGSWYWVDTTIVPALGPDGKPERFVAIRTDITERKRVEEALRHSQTTLAQAGRMARLGAWEIEVSDRENINANPLVWSEETYRILGYDPGAVTVTNELFFTHVHADDRQLIIDAVAQAIRTREPYSIEHRIIRTDGTEIVVQEYAELSFDQQGNLTRIIGTVQDITERKRAEQALRESETRFSTAFRASPDAQVISRLDDGTIGEVNESFLNLFGYTRDEVIGRTSVSLGMFADADHRDRLVATMKEHGRLRDFEACIKLRSGEERDASLTAEQLSINGEPVILTVIRDITDRKRAQETIRKSEARFRQLADSMPQLVWTANPDGTVDYYNQRHLEYAGIDRSPDNHYVWAPALHPDDGPRTAEAWERAVRTGETYQIEHRVRTLDGRYRWLLSRGIPARDEQGNIVKWYGTATDIDNVKRTEEALRESEERFRTLADNMSQFAWMTDRNGWIFWYNRRWYEYTGATFEDMQGWGWQKVHHPDHVERVTESFKKSLASGEPWEDTFPLRSETGDYRWFLSRALPIRDSYGNVVRWFGTNTDITDHLQIQHELQQRTTDLAAANKELSRLHRETRSILESIAEMYVVLRRDWTILDMNHMAEQYTFFSSRDQVVGRKLWEIAPNEPEETEFYRHFTDAFEQNTPVHFEALSTTLNKWFDVHAYPSTDGSRLAIYYHDITARRQALLDLEHRTRELEAANDDLRRLGSFLAHDLRAPLRTVRGFAEALKEDLGQSLNDEHRDYLDRIVSGSNDLDGLIQDLLRLTRLDTSNLDIDTIDIGEIAEGILENLAAREPDRRCRFTIAENLRARADHRLLSVALTNLLANAMKFTAHRELTEIEIASEFQNDQTVFFVRDNGVGFDMDKAEQLFQPFRRLHAHQGYPGTGLGLTIVQRVIARHHGRIWAAAAPDTGATFYFTLGT